MDRPVICGALMEESGNAMKDSAVSAREMGADCLEVRADALEDLDDVASLLKEIREATELPLILTCRKADEGGLFKGTEEERMAVLLAALPEADMVDIELRMEPGKRNAIVGAARDHGTQVICSYHDFTGTPVQEDLVGVFTEEFGAGADIAKVAAMAEDSLDILILLEAAQRTSARGRICAIPMGEAGKPGRAMAPFFGSVLNYAYVGRETGPGQLSVKELRTIFDIMGK